MHYEERELLDLVDKYRSLCPAVKCFSLKRLDARIQKKETVTRFMRKQK